MKRNFIPIIICILFIGFTGTTFSQGCVAIRNMSCNGASINLSTGNSSFLLPGEWQASLNYRHFKSFRHFRGKHEEENRIAEGTEVINWFNSFDVGLGYSASNRLSFNIVMPITTNNRSSMYEHYGNSISANPNRNRFETQSAGIGDLRVSATYWILNPEKHHSGNFALGLGIKAPTGNANVQDDFHKLDQEGNDYTVRRAVDQSIQLGDGGWGVSLELQGYQMLFGNTSLYFNGFYLSNPKNINNTLRNINLNIEDPFSYLSVADQYAARLGFNQGVFGNIAFSLGGRIEGIPAYDIIGKEEGFRRPGYIVSIEPGVSYQTHSLTFNLNVPVALVRDRIRNTRDIATNSHGDAAFADYLINAGISYRFGDKKQPKIKNWNELNN